MDEYDFIKNKVSDPKIWFIATFLGSLNSFLENVKETGKTIYGEDLLKKIDVNLTFFDRLKIWLQQMYALSLSYIAFSFDRKQALKYAFKCTLWQEEFDCFHKISYTPSFMTEKDNSG